eukprot:scaffold195136_cov38-Prasinocladus_malaysianus.AAC.1
MRGFSGKNASVERITITLASMPFNAWNLLDMDHGPTRTSLRMNHNLDAEHRQLCGRRDANSPWLIRASGGVHGAPPSSIGAHTARAQVEHLDHISTAVSAPLRQDTPSSLFSVRSAERFQIFSSSAMVPGDHVVCVLRPV